MRLRSAVQVQLSMVAMVLHTALPQVCAPERLAYGPEAVIIRALADAAQDATNAALPLHTAEASLQTQCRRLHVLLYVRPRQEPLLTISFKQWMWPSS